MFAKGKWHYMTETTGMVSPKYAKVSTDLISHGINLTFTKKFIPNVPNKKQDYLDLEFFVDNRNSACHRYWPPHKNRPSSPRDSSYVSLRMTFVRNSLSSFRVTYRSKWIEAIRDTKGFVSLVDFINADITVKSNLAAKYAKGGVQKGDIGIERLANLLIWTNDVQSPTISIPEPLIFNERRTILSDTITLKKEFFNIGFIRDGHFSE